MRTRQQAQAAHRRSQRQPAAATPGPTRRSQRIANRNAQSQQADSVPSAECASELQAAMAKSRAKSRRRHGVCAESCGHAAADPMPARPAGLWDLLPPELLDMILDLCCPKKLAMLETSCSFFRKTKMIQTVAETRLRAIPRAKGTTPASKSVRFKSVQHDRMCPTAATPFKRRSWSAATWLC